MRDRITGATDAQIEAAVAKWKTCPEKDVPAFRRVVTGYAEDLVPPDHRIMGPEDLAALRRVVEYHRALTNVDQKLDDDRVEAGAQLAEWLLTWTTARDALTADDLGRLAALIGDDGNE
jgi:hypothetical protein